ncbi:MAG TPA: YqaE/Pmp3 family membrane protein [Azospira sp.]|nr:YqaE/Pmp3 family membrane protein [Azospira sp.]
MSYILALFLPWLAVMLKGRVFVGIVLLILQITLIGWLPATVVALFIVHQENTKDAIAEAMGRKR